MNLHEIPFKVMITMPQCADRRWRLHENLCHYGIADVIAEHPVPLHDINAQEYSHLPQKALPYISQILTLKKVIGDARRRNAHCVWLFEDDAVLHPEFLSRARRLRVPNNWRFLYLGGAYYESVVRINEFLVRPSKVLDLHCVIISSEMYDIIEDRFDAALHDTSRNEVFADMILADLHKIFPAYLCRPNLSWQSNHQSDLNGRHYSSYKPDGEQWHKPSKLPFTAVYTLRTKGGVEWSGFSHEEALVKSFQYSAYLAQSKYSRVVLYTDTEGRELLKEVYFDEIFVTLDSFDVNPAINWAAKLDTLIHQTEPFVHIQPDVFLLDALHTTDDRILMSRSLVRNREQAKSANWLRNLPWKPNFVKAMLGRRRKLDIGNSRILGSRDTDFLKWYGVVCLEILRKPDNLQEINNLSESTRFLAMEAIEQWMMALCAAYRSKRFLHVTEDLPPATIPESTIRTSRLASRRSGRMNQPASVNGVIDLSAANVKLSPQSSSRYVRYVKSGHGWYIDLQNVGHKVVIGSKPSIGWEYLRDVYGKLGIMCEPYIPDPSDKELEKSQAHTPEHKRLRALIRICAKAKKKNAGEFLIFETGALFHPDIHNLIHRIRVPYDWRFLYLGGNSVGEEEWVGRGLVKSDNILGLEAIVIRNEMIAEIERVLADPLGDGELCVTRISRLHKVFPAYLCEPRLAWMESNSSQESTHPAVEAFSETE